MPAILLALLIAACSPSALEEPAPPTAPLEPYAPPTQREATPTLQGLADPQVPQGPSPTPFVHVIKEGDTLLGISVRYGVDLEQLLIANPGIDPGFLSLGQEIFIPGPDGETPGSLFPTPTPAPLDVSDPRCYGDRTGGTWCIVQVRNPASDIIEDLSGVISVYDAAGDLVDSESVFGAVNLIPVGGSLPLVGRFERPMSDFAHARFNLVSAIKTADSSSRYLQAEVLAEPADFEADGRLALLEGEYRIDPDSFEGTAILRIVGIALDDAGDAVGMSKWENEIDPGEFTGSFSMTLFSLGPRIEAVEYLIEAQVID
jgi:LysM repeat protein